MKAHLRTVLVDPLPYYDFFFTPSHLSKIFTQKIYKTSFLIWTVSIVGYDIPSSARDDVLTYHRIIESFKFSYAWRSLLGDPKFDIRIVGVGDM